MSRIEITSELINGIVENDIPRKVELWNKHYPQLQFDKYGRTKLAEIDCFNEELIRDEILCYDFSKEYKKAFNKYLEVNEYTIKTCDNSYIKQIDWIRQLAPKDFIDNTFHVINKFDKKVTIKVSKVLAKVHEYWMEDFKLYKKVTDEIKELRKKGETYDSSWEIRELTKDKENMESGNTSIRYESVLNSNRGSKTLWLSINPLDKLTSSGQSGDNPTQFSSCWSLRFEKRYEDSDWSVRQDGCYSSPQGCIAIGQVINNGIIYLDNGKTLKPIQDMDFEFIGYKERSHVWIDTNGMWIEKLYPTKSYSRKNEIISCVASAGIKVLTDGDISEYKDFDIQDTEHLENYCRVVDSDSQTLFFDRVVVARGDGYKLKYLDTDRMNYSYDSGDDYPDYNEDKTECPHCGRMMDTENDDCVWIEGLGEYVCRNCFDEYYVWCDNCEEYHRRRDSVYFESEDIWMCESCAERYGFQCHECGEWFRTDDGTDVRDKWGDWITVCEGCLSDYQWCDCCEEYHHERNMNHIESLDTNVCNDCRDNHVVTCEECGKEIWKEDVIEVAEGKISKLVCKDCHKKDEDVAIDDEEVV